MPEEVEARVAEILALVLERPVLAGENLRRVDEPRWDSLKHLEIVFAVEGAFGVRFSVDEIADVRAAADLVAKARG